MSQSEISDELDQIIRVLPDVLANKIAAGEVVERPASAVKELVENSIDAAASRVEIRLGGSGSDLIQIVDDGCGMSPGDAALAFRRHATSKIRSIEDLERVRTLGFRGEAVASIAAVSRASIRTKRRADLTGIEIRVHGGETVSTEPAAATEGTTVSVRNLFFNVPARRKFLKAPATELRRILEVVEALALSHPDIAFALYHDDKELINVHGATPDVNTDPLLERILDLFGRHDKEELVRVSEETSYLSVHGFVGKASMNRKSRGRQYLFVNGRSVRNRYLEHAVRSAYQALLQDGEYPFFVLFVDLDPSHVDVNVHPTKAEVKFDDERGVYSFVRTMVARALSEADAAPLINGQSSVSNSNWRFDESDTSRRPVGIEPWSEARGRSGGDLSELLYGAHTPGGDSQPAESGFFLDRSKPVPVDIWQINEQFLVVQLRQGLLIIDQNTAHERVLYERALDSLKGGGGFSQQLLFPKTLELAASDFGLVKELLPDLRRLGFDVELFGGRSVLLRGVPTGIKEGAAESLLEEILGEYGDLESASMSRPRHDILARSIARKSAIRAGEILSQSEMRGLVDQLMACSDAWHSPSGGTTIIRLGIGELERLLSKR